MNVILGGVTKTVGFGSIGYRTLRLVDAMLDQQESRGMEQRLGRCGNSNEIRRDD